VKLASKITALIIVFLGLTASVYANPEAAAVLAANQARNTALVAHDLEALNRLLAPDFNYTQSNSFHETKAMHMGFLKGGLHFSKYETSQLRANVITPDEVTLNGLFE
jgi:predicted GNAT superfamily acetyltransferase